MKEKLKFESSWLVWAPSLVACVLLAGSLHGEDYLSEEQLFMEDLDDTVEVSDPFEEVNRYTFRFNDFVYLNLLEPLSEGYQAITPDPVEVAASNFFTNLNYPVRLAGNLLQGRLRGAWVETGRFVINSTVGLGGFSRPADDIEGFAPIPPEDIGQALGSWGIGEGPYLVLPLLGPSNVRDFVGLFGDRAVDPLEEPFSLIDDWDWELRLALTATEFTVRSPALLKRYRELKGSAIDPYSSLKNGYTQFRQKAVEE